MNQDLPTFNDSCCQKILKPEEQALQNLLRVLTVLFGAGSLCFLFGSNLQMMNVVSTEKFWWIHTIAMMLTLTAIAFQAQRDIKSNYKLTTFLILSTGITTFLFLGYFFIEKRVAYLLGAGCDGLIFLITLIFYGRLCRTVAHQAEP